MDRQILTTILNDSQLREELTWMVKHFKSIGVENCKVLFGFSWGNEYYSNPKWVEEEIPLSWLLTKVSEVESTGIGSLGRDDLFVWVSGVEFQFCHDGDVHIHFNEPTNSLVEVFFERWQCLGYKPSEWVKTTERGPGTKVR